MKSFFGVLFVLVPTMILASCNDRTNLSKAVFDNNGASILDCPVDLCFEFEVNGATNGLNIFPNGFRCEYFVGSNSYSSNYTSIATMCALTFTSQLIYYSSKGKFAPTAKVAADFRLDQSATLDRVDGLDVEWSHCNSRNLRVCFVWEGARKTLIGYRDSSL